LHNDENGGNALGERKRGELGGWTLTREEWTYNYSHGESEGEDLQVGWENQPFTRGYILAEMGIWY